MLIVLDFNLIDFFLFLLFILVLLFFKNWVVVIFELGVFWLWGLLVLVGVEWVCFLILYVVICCFSFLIVVFMFFKFMFN